MANDLTNMGSAQTVSNSGHLVDYEFLPAVIVETDDPLHYGRIKVSALGAYNSNNSPASHLPWCYPFTMTGNASYASYEKGSKVWLFRNKKRQDENWFIPMYELHDQPQQFVNQNADKKAEVISMRNNGGGKSAITYDHGDGYNISTSGSTGGAGINVGTNSTATVSGGGSSVKVENSMVTVGSSGGATEPAVLGNKLKEWLESLLNTISQMMLALKADPYASPAVSVWDASVTNLMTNLTHILSENVQISEGGESSESSSASEDRSHLGPVGSGTKTSDGTPLGNGSSGVNTSAWDYSGIQLNTPGMQSGANYNGPTLSGYQYKQNFTDFNIKSQTNAPNYNPTTGASGEW